MKNMFNRSSSLSSLPIISKWDIKNLKNKNEMIEGFKKSLNILPQFKKNYLDFIKKDIYIIKIFIILFKLFKIILLYIYLSFYKI